MFPCGIHAGSLDGVHHGNFSPFFAVDVHRVQLVRFGGQIFLHIEQLVGADVFSFTELGEVSVGTFIALEAVFFHHLGQLLFRPIDCRLGSLQLSQLVSHVNFRVKPSGISHVFILRRIIEVVLFLPSRPRVGRETVGQIPQKLRKRACGEGQPMSRWYPCRVSCKPSQGPPMRGTCPPKRPVERLVQSYAENYSAISWKYSGKYPCLPRKAVPGWNRLP